MSGLERVSDYSGFGLDRFQIIQVSDYSRYGLERVQLFRVWFRKGFRLFRVQFRQGSHYSGLGLDSFYCKINEYTIF